MHNLNIMYLNYEIKIELKEFNFHVLLKTTKQIQNRS
jgi:hypothetical protein